LTENLEAYTSYLRGQHLLRERMGKDMEQALLEFQRASTLDPKFALAHVGVAKSLTLLALYDYRNIARWRMNSMALDSGRVQSLLHRNSRRCRPANLTIYAPPSPGWTGERTRSYGGMRGRSNRSPITPSISIGSRSVTSSSAILTLRLGITSAYEH
jgi:hypothetical protein